MTNDISYKKDLEIEVGDEMAYKKRRKSSKGVKKGRPKLKKPKKKRR